MNWGSSGEIRGTIGWGIAENVWPKSDPHFENPSHVARNIRHRRYDVVIKFLTSCINPAAVQILSLSYALRAVGMGMGALQKAQMGPSAFWVMASLACHL